MLHNQRESDGDYYAKQHPTYTNRPSVELQLASAACKLAGLRGVLSGTVLDKPVPAVPATQDAVYDPSSDKADWGGMVSKEQLGKKLFSGHASMARGIEQTENGMVSLSTAQEWGRRRQPSAETSKVLRFGNQGIIGGISADNRWETESDRFSSGAGTRRDQLSKAASAASASAAAASAQPRMRPQLSYSSQPTPREDERDSDYSYSSVAEETSLIGYRAPPQTKSLISNMAAAIANSVAEDFKPQSSAAKTATLGAPPKHVSGAIPGYTGHRTRR